MSAQQLIIDHLDLWTGAVTHKSGSGRSASGKNGKIELTGIKKLRELILELAVRGKLVEQDPSDEPASVLLDRIAKEKARLVKEGKIKKPKKLPEIAEEEKPFELPWNWSWVRLGNISQINPRNGADDDLEASFIPMPLISSLYNGEHGQELRPWKEMKKGYTHIADGDIAIAKITPCFENSKAAIFNNLKNGIGAGTTELHVARPFGNTLNPCYVLLCLKSPRFLSNGERKMTGSAGQKRVPKDFFAGEPLPFAPLPEQHRIVEKVDELMALCDRLEQQVGDQLEAHKVLVDTLLEALVRSADTAELADNWARVAEHFDTLFTTEASIEKLKQTILQLAVMGRLVEQDARDEPADNLLGQLAKVKQELIAQGLLKKERKSQPVDSKDAPYEIPGSWSWCKLTDIGELARGKSKHRPRNDPSLYQEGTVPLIQTGDVARASPWITTFSARYNQRGVEQSRLWRPGTLCITIAANIGDTGLLSFDASFPDSVVGFTPFWSDIPPEYFEYFLRTAKQHLEDFAPSTAQKNINLEVLQKLLVPLPPVPEMKRIVQKVDELMSLCDRLKARLSKAGETRSQLAEAVVDQAVS